MCIRDRMESQNKPRIAVVGAGAIGGITAAYLAKAGYDVHLVCKHEEIAQKALSLIHI